jgi:hypothetical protein
MEFVVLDSGPPYRERGTERSVQRGRGDRLRDNLVAWLSTVPHIVLDARRARMSKKTLEIDDAKARVARPSDVAPD